MGENQQCLTPEQVKVQSVTKSGQMCIQLRPKTIKKGKKKPSTNMSSNALHCMLDFSTCHPLFFFSQILFSNIEEILGVHREFVSALDASLQPEPQPQHALGHVFLQFVSLSLTTKPFDHQLTFI